MKNYRVTPTPTGYEIQEETRSPEGRDSQSGEWVDLTPRVDRSSAPTVSGALFRVLDCNAQPSPEAVRRVWAKLKAMGIEPQSSAASATSEASEGGASETKPAR